MSIASDFRDRVERFLSEQSVTPTALGVGALKDPNFVFQLRNNRRVSGETMDRVLAYIEQEEGRGPHDMKAAS